MCDVDANGARTCGDAPTNSKLCSGMQMQAVDPSIKSLFKRYFDVAIVCVVIAAVWALLALPTIFYHLPKVTVQSCYCNRSTACLHIYHEILVKQYDIPIMCMLSIHDNQLIYLTAHLMLLSILLIHVINIATVGFILNKDSKLISRWSLIMLQIPLHFHSYIHRLF